jgi:Glycosyltransferase
MGFKVVMTNHGPDYERKKWNLPAKVILWKGEWLGSVFSNAVICISETIASGIRRRFHREVTVIPNGVDIPELAKTHEILKKYGLEKGKYVLAVGRFVPEKGFHDLIDAFGHRNDGWKVVIVGDADHEDEYSRGLKIKIAAKVKAGIPIVLTGRLTGTPLKEIYSHAGLFVLPSYYEGLPIVLLEAMSYGLSCVVSGIPANKEVSLGEDRYFKAGDVGVLAKKIEEFIERPMSGDEKRQQIDMVRAKYDWDDIAKKTLKVYERVLK